MSLAGTVWILGILVLSIWCVGLQSEAGLLFRANFDADAAPRFGFTNQQTRHLSATYTQSSMPGAGPAREDAVQIAYTGIASGSVHCSGRSECEGYVGWGEPNPMPPVPQGSALYIRIKFRLIPPFAGEPAWNRGAWGGKFIILGDGADPGDPSDDQSRIIWNLEASPADYTQARFKIQKNIDSQGEIVTKAIPPGKWHYYQLKVQSSSPFPRGNNAGMWLYVDEANANEKTPTHTGDQFDVSTGRWDDSFKLGAYTRWMGTGGRVVWQIAAVEIDDAFDPGWRERSTSPP